jgi:protein-tyrosine phosphatase
VTDYNFQVNPFFVDKSQPSRLTDRLYLSGMHFARQHDALRALGVECVVNLTPDDDGCLEAGFEVLQLTINDAEEPARVNVTTFLTAMRAWHAEDKTVLIHCHAGVSRTSAFAIAWLMAQRGANADTDLRTLWSSCEDQVGKVRDIIMPHYLLKRAVLHYFESIQP